MHYCKSAALAAGAAACSVAVEVVLDCMHVCERIHFPLHA
jgi:hypothetical protein